MRVLFAITCLMFGYSFAEDLLIGANTPKNKTTINDVTCYKYKKFTVLTKDDMLGQDILIKNNAQRNCTWNESDGWLTESNSASYFVGSYGDNILIDRGTASAPRDILIYNYKTGKNIFKDSYSSDIAIANNKLSYWRISGVIATDANCTLLSQAESSGLGVHMLRQTYVDLSRNNLNVKYTDNHRCELTQ